MLSGKEKCRRNFCRKYATSTVPCRRAVYEIVETFESTCSVLDKNRIRNFYVSTAVGVSES